MIQRHKSVLVLKPVRQPLHIQVIDKNCRYVNVFWYHNKGNFELLYKFRFVFLRDLNPIRYFFFLCQNQFKSINLCWDSWVPWTARRASQSILKEISPNIHWKDWCWSWNYNILATWCEELTIGKDPDAGKDWRQEEKGTTEDEMVGWHHWFNGHEFE